MRSVNHFMSLLHFVFRQAAELSEGLGGSATQQAIVHAFLQDYDRVQYLSISTIASEDSCLTWSFSCFSFSFQAIDILTRATRITSSTNLCILLGKTCMKAKQFENAIASFKRAIFNLVRWNVLYKLSSQPWPSPLASQFILFLGYLALERWRCTIAACWTI